MYDLWGGPHQSKAPPGVDVGAGVKLVGGREADGPLREAHERLPPPPRDRQLVCLYDDQNQMTRPVVCYFVVWYGKLPTLWRDILKKASAKQGRENYPKQEHLVFMISQTYSSPPVGKTFTFSMPQLSKRFVPPLLKGVGHKWPFGGSKGHMGGSRGHGLSNRALLR